MSKTKDSSTPLGMSQEPLPGSWRKDKDGNLIPNPDDEAMMAREKKEKETFDPKKGELKVTVDKEKDENTKN